jgi:hypothetical protein
MNKKLIASFVLIAAVAMAFMPVFAGAQLPPGTEPSVSANRFQSLEGVKLFIRDVVLGTLKWAFWILAAIMILYAAFIYLTAGGDPDKVKKASHMLLYAAIAMAVALLATVLPNLVASIVSS